MAEIASNTVKLTSPYNFVPLNSKVYIPDWYNLVSQDIPFEDGEDGYIELTWHNDSPLFIRDKDKDDDEHAPMNINGRYFIPGSSIKGMLRNVLSILAFGKMQEGEQYKDRFFGHREFNTKLSEGKKYQELMGKVKFGWLQKDGEDFYLYPCVGDADKMPIIGVTPQFGLDAKEPYYTKESAWERNEILSHNKGWFPEVKINGKTYRLFATGKLGEDKGKKNELLIPDDTEEGFKLSKQTVKKFLTVYEHTPGFSESVDNENTEKGNFIKLLNDGQEIPVSFIEGQTEDGILAMGMGKMFRFPYKHNIQELVEMEQKESEYKDKKNGTIKRDLCETIFGWIGNDSAKGRVQFGNAWADDIDKSQLEEEQSGVLGQPRASYYPLYIKQDKKTQRYNTYEGDNSRISGRKRYRIYKDNKPQKLIEGSPNVTTHIRAIPADHDFKMRINIHNLRKAEIGALLSAITFHGTDNVWHNIGAAKSFGYGKIKCVDIQLHNLKYDVNAYMGHFELEMDAFTKKNVHQSWCCTPQITMLLGIMSEHEDAKALKMMTLDGENTYIDNAKQFSVLKENSVSLKSLITPANSFQHRHEEEYRQVEAGLLSEDIDVLRETCVMLNGLIEEKLQHNLDATAEKDTYKTLKNKIQELEERAVAQLAAEESAKTQERLQRGLLSILEGPPQVSSWKVCDKKISKWLRDKGASATADSDKDAIEETVRRLIAEPTREEKERWTKRDSHIWKALEVYLGKERADNLFKKPNDTKK